MHKWPYFAKDWKMSCEEDDRARYEYDEADSNGPSCVCGRHGDDACGCCGAPLCFMCFETGAGFCAGMPCATEERLAALDAQLRGEEDGDDDEQHTS